MKKMKKALAVILSLAMVLGMSLTAFAGEVGDTPVINKPTADNTATATVQNVEAGATVTAYRIVEPSYNDKGFIGYKAIEGVTLANILEPTS
ncbi:hypothetical protein C817_05928, partial [Dorea sp. 5-2]